MNNPCYERLCLYPTYIFCHLVSRLAAPVMLVLVCIGMPAHPVEGATVSNVLNELRSKQQLINSFICIVDTTTYDNRPSTQDRVLFRKAGGLFRIEELPGFGRDAILTDRLAPVTHGYDGEVFWMEVGKLVVRSAMDRSSASESLFCDLNTLDVAAFSAVETNAPSGVRVFERPIPDPMVQKIYRDFVEQPTRAFSAASMEGHLDREQIRERLDQLKHTAPHGYERLWFKSDTGFCYLREEYDNTRKKVRQRVYVNCDLNPELKIALFRPSIEGKRLLTAPWPHDDNTRLAILEESHSSRKLPTAIPGSAHAQERRNYDRSTRGLIKVLEDSWLKKDLQALRLQTEGHDWLPTSWLARLVFLELVENDLRSAVEVRERLRVLVPDMVSYEESLKALEQATKAIPNHLTKEDRLRMVFQLYPNGFPLQDRILRVGMALNKLGSTSGTATKRLREPVYFECREDQVFHLDRAALGIEVAKAFSKLSRMGTIDAALQQEFLNTTIGDAAYMVDPQAILQNGELRLSAKKGGSSGSTAASLKEKDSIFQNKLHQFNASFHIITFLVRRGNRGVCDAARQIAEAAGYETVVVEMESDQLIRFRPDGSLVEGVAP